MTSRYMSVVGAGVLILSGCESATSYAPVSGKVTLDGTPLAGAQVSFQPEVSSSKEEGYGSYAKTGPDGMYTLNVSKLHVPGAKPGPHKVFISLAVYDTNNPNPDSKDIVPEKYRDGPDALRFDVPPHGTSSADFVLVTPPGWKPR
jgi:hypothetical protein